MAMVAAPIAILTSYVLYQRCKLHKAYPSGERLINLVVLGEERKRLVPQMNEDARSRSD